MERSASRDAMLNHHPDIINPPAYPALLSALFYVVERGDLNRSNAAESGPRPSSAGLKSLVARGVLSLFGWPILWAVLVAVWLLVVAQQAWFLRVPAETLPWHAAGILVCVVMLALSWMPATSFKVGSEIAFTVFVIILNNKAEKHFRCAKVAIGTDLASCIRLEVQFSVITF